MHFCLPVLPFDVAWKVLVLFLMSKKLKPCSWSWEKSWVLVLTKQSCLHQRQIHNKNSTIKPTNLSRDRNISQNRHTMLYLFNISYPVFYVVKRSFIRDIVHQHNSLFTRNSSMSKKNCWKIKVQIKRNKNIMAPRDAMICGLPVVSCMDMLWLLAIWLLKPITLLWG